MRRGAPFGVSPYSLPTHGRISESFMPREQLIPHPDFRNHDDVIHNNLGDDLEMENITEYTPIICDSDDRDTLIYTNPFNFAVILGGVSARTDTETTPTGQFKTTVYPGSPKPILQRNFRNVKYVRIDDIILPKTNVIDTAAGPNKYKMTLDTTKWFSAMAGLIFKTDELHTDRVFTTGSINDNENIIYIDQIMGTTDNYWKPTHKLRTYPTSKLLNLDRLTFHLYTRDRTELNTVDELGNVLNVPNIISHLVNPIERATLTETYENMRMIIEFTFGVIEAELNTLPKFNR
jgi:hypothetical protein